MAEEYIPLTTDSICKDLHEVDWIGLGLWLKVPRQKLNYINQQHATQANRTRATIEYWLTVDPAPSWRRVVWALEWSKEHKAAERVKPYVEPLTDPSLTAENVSSVLESVRDWGTVSLVLRVSHSRINIIEREYSSETQWRQAAVDCWLQYSPTASWTWLAGELYYLEERTALEAVSQYIHKETADPTLTLINLWSQLGGVTNWWAGFGMCWQLQVPNSVVVEIRKQTSDVSQQKKTLLERWLQDHPAPSWAVVAEALYQAVEHGVLEQVKKMYITGSAKEIFKEAMCHGYVNSQVTKVLVTGIAGSGKTCTKHVLIDEPPPPVRKSTPCAETPLRLQLTKVGVRRREVKWERTGSKRLVTYLAAAAKLHTKLEARKAKAHQPSGDHREGTQAPKGSASRLQHEARPEVANKKLVSEQESVGTSSRPIADDFMLASPQSRVFEPALETSVTEEELVRLIEQSVGSELLHEIEWVQLVDSGGQPQFLEVYPVFHRRTSVWVFVLKLSERLDDRPTVEYYDQDGKLVCKPYTAAHTTKQILLYSIRSLRSHGCVPKILIIGTHKDKENECGESREAKNQQLQEILLPEFEKELISCGDEVIFPLNAQSPGEDERRIAEEIRRVIMEQCSPQVDTLPLGWYALELKLKEIAEALGQQVVSWKVCFEMARKLHFDEQSFNAALCYLDELNIIYYYRGILSEMIFCDTQVLLDKVTELVQMSFKLREKPTPGGVGAVGHEWRRFRDYGVVNSKFLQSNFNKHYVPGLFTSRELIKLFDSLLVLAEFSEEGCYFMPCLLRRLTQAEVEKHRSNTSFILHFPHGTRNGIFCSLMAFLISNNNHFPHPWSLDVHRSSSTPVCLSRNCIVFAIPGFPGSVSLVDSDKFYEVHINTPIDLQKMCEYVRDAMIHGLEKAATNLHYTNSRPVVAFPCPCSQGELHPATVGIDQTLWLCSINRQMCGQLEEKQLRWICSKPTSESAVSISPTITAARATATAVYEVVEEACKVLESTTLQQKAEEQLGEDDFVDIMGYLHTMDKHQLNHLGMVLGLSRHRVRGMMDTPTFLDDMISSWLQQVDKVATKSGVPTWKTLATALRHPLLGQSGIASQIATDKSLE